jgi:serine/threonine-protein kinase
VTSLAPGYEVIREIGQGGMGKVYLARARDGAEVAIKVLSGTSTIDALERKETLERFDRERRLQGAFAEVDGFVPLLDAGWGPAGPFVVMPFVGGGSLRDRLRRGPLAIAEARELGRALAAALARAHERGIVHRDLKPENILYTREGKPLVADLGLAKHFRRDLPGASRSVQLSESGDVQGTPGYMAPEQMLDSSAVGPPADVFALGAILHEALAGRRAFAGRNTLELLRAGQEGRRDPLSSVRPGVPADLAATIERALASDPAARFRDAGELLRGLEAAPARRRPLGLALGVAGALVAAGVLLRPRPAPPAPPPPPVAHLTSASGPAMPRPLRRADHDVPAVGGETVALYLYRLPDGTDMEMVSVPKGDFVMGSEDADAYEDERPIQRHMDPFWIGRTEVTWRQYLAFWHANRDGEPEKPPHFELIRPDLARHPAVSMTWDEAKAYCDWAGLALPTEAEWEWAARGTDGRKYPWGNDWNAPGTRAIVPTRTTTPVDAFPSGVSPVGVLDMAANVFQWCDGWYEWDYGRFAKEDLSPAPRSQRVARGGGFHLKEDPPRHCRTTNRRHQEPSDRSDMIGFRAVLR